MTEKHPRERRFTAALYVQSLRSIVLVPGEFFGELRESPAYTHPAAFLLTSSVLHALLSIPFLPVRPLLMMGIVFLNALLMPVISASLGYLIALAVVRRPIPFATLFPLYAYASAATLLLSWIPLALWITEPWRWILIGIGMVRGCGFSRLQAAAVIAISIAVLMGLFSALSPILQALKG